MTEEQDIKKQVKKKNSFTQRSLKALLYLILLFAFFSIGLVVLAQFKFFRNFALGQILGIVNQSLIAKIEADDLTFWNPDGIKIFGARLLTDGDTLAYVPELILNVNYEDLLNQKVTVNKLILNKPDIRLLRNSLDSTWNYDKIAPPSDDTTNSGPTPWEIYVKHLELNNANFKYYDSTKTYVNYQTMDYEHLELNGFDLSISAIILPGKNDFSVNIKNLTAFEENSQMSVDFKGKLGINEKLIYAKDIAGKLNDSEFDIQAEMSKFNVFDTINPPDIEKAEFKVALKGFNIGDEMIYKFAVIPISFGSNADLLIDAEGSLKDMEVERLNLVTGKSDINISGNMKSLLDMEFFEYEFSLDKSVFTRIDIIKTLKSIDLSGIPLFSQATAERLYVKGFIDSVYSDMHLKTDIGNLKGKAGVNYEVENMRYFVNAEFEKLNLKHLLKDDAFSSNLNGKLYFKGEGIDIDNLNAFLETEIYNSEMYDIKFSNLSTKIHAKNKLFSVESLSLRIFDKSNEELIYDFLETPYVSLTGDLDLADVKNPAYKFNIDITALDVNSLITNPALPDYLTSKINIDMKGFELDSLNGSFNAEINGLGYKDRAFMPFVLAGEFSKDENDFRSIAMQTDFFKVSIDGKFNFSDLIESLTFQGIYFSDYINEKLESFNPKRFLNLDTNNIDTLYYSMSSFPDIDAVLSAEIQDLSTVNIFLDSLSLYSSFNINCRLNSNSEKSTLMIDSLNVSGFDMIADDLVLKTSNLVLNGMFVMNYINSIPSIETLHLNLDSTPNVQFNDLLLNDLYSLLSFENNDLNYEIGSKINNEFTVTSKGKIIIKEIGATLEADSLSINYLNLFQWQNKNPILVNTNDKSINVNQFDLYRDNAESINIFGVVDDDFAKNLNLQILNAPITDFLALTDEETQKKYGDTRLILDSLRIRVNGDLKAPRIITSVYADSVIFNKYKIGTLNGRLIHNSTYIHGFFDIKSPQDNKIFGIDVNYLPIYLGINPDIPFMDSTKSLDIRLKATRMPLELIEPFAPGVKDFSGFADASIVVEGAIQDGIEYSGSANSDNARLKVENTNIFYNAEVKIDFDKDKINLTKINIRNIPEDSRFGRIGKASATGTIEMIGFDFGELDIRISADRLLVMSDATMITMPDLYGDFIISNESIPLRFFGTLDKPNLEGEANIIYAHLKMPMETKKTVVRTYFTYKVMGDKVRIQSTTSRDESDEEKDKEAEGLAPSIADLINYNLSAKILGQFIVEMDMSLIGSMYAVIGTTDRSLPLRYEKRREESEGKLFGEVVVKDQSTIKSWKQFTTSGKINFPTGSIENPSLDLSATHTGTMLDDGARKQFIVKMYITGFKENPAVRFTYFIDGVEPSGSQEQINEDALYLLVTGRTKTGSGGGGPQNANLLNEGFASGVSNFATKALSDLLMGTGVINSAEFDFQGGSMNLGDATLRLSGQLYGGISWTIGGTVADLSSNNQITIDIPASEFSNNPFWSNFVLQLSKASSNNVMANSQEAKNWEVKIKLGSSW